MCGAIVIPGGKTGGTAPIWRLKLFGRMSVVGTDVTIDNFSTRRSAFLLARAALSQRKEIARSDAADALWPEDFYDATRLRLRQELSRLRRALGPAGEILHTDSDWIRLDTSVLVTDVQEFEAVLGQSASEIDPSRREGLLRRAIEIASEPLLEGADESWVLVERTRLQESLYGAILTLAEGLEARSDSAGALSFARRAVDLRPADEAAHVLVMQILAGLGRTSESLSQFQVLKKAVLEAGGKISQKVERLIESLKGTPSPDKPPSARQSLRFRTPHTPEPIHGRDSELSELSARLRPSAGGARFVTLLGPGGIGKTRLLQEAAIRLRVDFEGRVSSVDLSELSDDRLVPIAILSELGAETVPTEDPARHLLGILPHQAVLLALDNLEQFGPPTSALIQRMLQERPELRILATSRTALGVPGEHRLQVGPLPLPRESDSLQNAAKSPAMRLFLETAGRDSFQQPMDQKELLAIRSLVRRLEGLPLAIQLAASRMRVLGAEELDVQLQKSLDVLDVKRPGVPKRHQSVRRAVEDSVQALSPDLQQVLAGLSTFRGGWTLESAQAVCDLEDSLASMESLLDASLIYVAREGRRIRFRMLEAIRAYARTRLDDAQTLDARRRHAEWVLGLAESVEIEYFAPQNFEAFNVVESELDNLREAIRFALDKDSAIAFKLGASLPFFWRCRSNGFEGMTFYEELFERFGSEPATVDMAKSAYGACFLAQMIGTDRWLDIYDHGVKVCRQTGLTREEAMLCAFRGYQAQNNVRYAEADACFQEAESLLGRAARPCDRALVAMYRGFSAYHRGDAEEAAALLESAIAVLGEVGEVFYRSRSRQLLALAAADLGRFDEAEAALSGLMETILEARLDPLVPFVSNATGFLALRTGRFDDAIRSFEASRGAWSVRQIPYQIAEQNHWLGFTYWEAGDLDLALDSFCLATTQWFDEGAHVAAGAGLIGVAAVLWQRKKGSDEADAVSLLGCVHRIPTEHKIRRNRYHQAFADSLDKEITAALGPDAINSGDLTLAAAIEGYARKQPIPELTP